MSQLSPVNLRYYIANHYGGDYSNIMYDIKNKQNSSLEERSSEKAANPRVESIQMEYSMGDNATVSQSMPNEAKVNPKQHSIEEITTEIIKKKSNVVKTFVEIGFLLIEAKEQLVRHGQWLSWLAYNVDISERMAERYMQLAKAYGNSTSVSDLGITKALILLELPEADMEAFINDLHEIDGQMLAVGEMTTRETRKVVRDKCRPVVTNDEPHKTFQPIRRDSVSNLYNKKRNTLLKPAEELDSEISSAKTHLDCIIDLLAEQKHSAGTYDRFVEDMQSLQKKISQCMDLIEEKTKSGDFS